jgi:3-hydroxyisobutyrate dehydrogenase
VNRSLRPAPLLISFFRGGIALWRAREVSPHVIRRLDEATGSGIRAPGCPPELVEDKPEKPGAEVMVARG